MHQRVVVKNRRRERSNARLGADSHLEYVAGAWLQIGHLAALCVYARVERCVLDVFQSCIVRTQEHGLGNKRLYYSTVLVGVSFIFLVIL